MTYFDAKNAVFAEKMTFFCKFRSNTIFAAA